MKRKIAAILAADVAGYSRLVAEDEEETLRRLQAYREVMDDFIAKASGRIFNTAGDAVLAEFASAVEAVRCAIDIQESLRTRNRAYPSSRQMNFRIGITIGDVVERNGDLLGDGVNIAARLEGIAPVGGICVSRTVYRTGRQQAVCSVRRYRRTAGQEYSQSGARIYGRSARRRRCRQSHRKPQTARAKQGFASPLIIAVAAVAATAPRRGYLFIASIPHMATDRRVGTADGSGRRLRAATNNRTGARNCRSRACRAAATTRTTAGRETSAGNDP